MSWAAHETLMKTEEQGKVLSKLRVLCRAAFAVVLGRGPDAPAVPPPASHVKLRLLL